MNKEFLLKIIDNYKAKFEQLNNAEIYKWQAIKHFQDNWDINADNFAEMLKFSFSKAANLLASFHYFPLRMLEIFSQNNPVAVKDMFLNLYDENIDLTQRIIDFQKKSDDLLSTIKKTRDNDSHFQNSKAIAVYLTFRFPEKYHLYKESVYKNVRDNINFSQPKGFTPVDKLIQYYQWCDKIAEYLKQDTELINMHFSRLSENEYKDENLHILVQDILFSDINDENNQFSIWKISHGSLSEMERKILFDNNLISLYKDTKKLATSKKTQAEQFDEDLSIGDYFYLCYGNEVVLLGQVDGECELCKVLDNDGWLCRHYTTISLPTTDNRKYTGEDKWWTPNHNSTCVAIPKNNIKVFEKLILKPFFNSSITTLLSANEISNEWYPLESEYTPELSVEQWLACLNNHETFSSNAKTVFKRLYEVGGSATCKQLSEKYGESCNFYNTNHYNFAKKVHQATNCRLYKRNDNTIAWWAIPSQGQNTSDKDEGAFYFKLRPELYDALKSYFENIKNPNNIVSVSNAEFLKWFAPIIEALKELGCSATPKEVREKIAEIYELDDDVLLETRGKTGVNKFQNEIAFARNYLVYEGFISGQTRGIWELTERGLTVEMNLELAAKIFDKWVKILTARRKGETEPVIDLTANYITKKIVSVDKYTKTCFLKDVYINETDYEILVTLLKRKKNVILQGAPGVGKTFAAKKLAFSIMGECDEYRICCVQFHQSYSYEDFIMGYRPSDSGFELRSGVFYNFCKRAEENPDKEYFFIIDEINRGNLSKIFGELLMLIEADKRGEKNKINLIYDGKAFYVPENLYIIGMMNTADRSIAMIDYALRRRFSFYKMRPAFNNDGFKNYQKNASNELFDKVIEAIKQLNNEIENDLSLGEGFMIGHSYFCCDNPESINDLWVKNIISYEIIPLIEEYWFDNSEKIKEERSKLLNLL